MEDEQISYELTPELQEQFELYKEKSNKRFQELEKAINLAAQKIDLLVKKKASRRSKKIESPAAKVKSGENKTVKLESLQHLKLNFPRFTEGLGVVEWFQDCEQYFSVYGVDDSKRVAVAGMHLQGTARKWFQVYIVGKNSLEWLEFCKQFTARFGSWEQELLYNKFKQLHQATTVDLYFDEFEKCKEQLRGRMPELTEEYFVESFIGGLQDQIRDTVRMLAPSSIDQAYRQAKQYVASGKTAREETKETKLTGQAGGSDRSAKLANIQEITSRNSRLSNVIRLTPQEADRRIKEGFCPYCMDKDGINHHCTQPCLFMLKKEENEEGLETLGSGQRCVPEKSDMEVEDNEQMEVSVHAIEGLHHNKTITLTGRRGKHQFSILIDGVLTVFWMSTLQAN